MKPRTWERRLADGMVSDIVGTFTVYKAPRLTLRVAESDMRVVSRRRLKIHIPDQQHDGLSGSDFGIIPQPMDRQVVLQKGK